MILHGLVLHSPGRKHGLADAPTALQTRSGASACHHDGLPRSRVCSRSDSGEQHSKDLLLQLRPIHCIFPRGQLARVETLKMCANVIQQSELPLCLNSHHTWTYSEPN